MSKHKRRRVPSRLSHRLHTGFLEQLREMFSAPWVGLADFLKDARGAFPAEAEDARFDFVATRLWRADYGDVPENWQETFKERYAAFVDEFEWHVDGAPYWATPHLVARTLSVFQKRTPENLSAQSALGMLLGVGRVGEALEMVS